MIIKMFILFFSFSALAASDNWQKIGETTDCFMGVTLKGKVGKNSIKALVDDKTYILFPQGNYVFQKESAIDLVFDSYNRKADIKYPQFKYVHPSSAKSGKRSIEIRTKEGKKSCTIKTIKMTQSGTYKASA